MFRIGEINIQNKFTNEVSSFSSVDAHPNSIWGTHINGEIEHSMQGDIGNCWLLTNLNCLKDTDWGKRIIKDSIKPDGNGGAIITFKGSEIEQKDFHITYDDIMKARQLGVYSDGDDDVIAMELAIERYLKIFRNQENKQNGEILNANGLSVSEFVKLLSGKTCKSYGTLATSSNLLADIEASNKEKLRFLEEIEKHPHKYATWVTFIGDTVDGSIMGEHAYQLQKVVTENNKKYVILINPHDSSKTIKKEVNEIIPYIELIDVTAEPGAEINRNLKNKYERMYDFRTLKQYLSESLYNLKDMDDIDNMDYEKIKYLTELVDENNIKELFTDVRNMKLLIIVCDRLKFGWGNGAEKKNLISPLVNAFCDYAKKQGVSDEIIDDVKKSCYKELDAMFYTDTTVIMEKLETLFSEIEKAQEKNPLNKMFGSKFYPTLNIDN